jgi:ABC-2 type transport system ATP-binding protein
MNEISVTADQLTRRFGDFTAVDQVTFEVSRGEIFGYLGANGAGKSTTIRMLTGLLAPSGGRGVVAGHDVALEPEAVKTSIGYMSQKFSLYLDLPVRENLLFFGGAYGLAGKALRARADAVLELTALGEFQDAVTGSLPGGIRQRLALGCAVLHRPEVVFLDEPTAGVDPVSRREFWEQIHQLASQGTTVMVTTHYMDEAERCHRLAFIFRGTVLDVGTPDEIVRRRDLRVAEFQVEDAVAAAAALRALPEVDEVAHYGHLIRLATLRGVDPEGLARGLLGPAVLSSRPARVTVEDAFVSMVRHDARAA